MKFTLFLLFFSLSINNIPMTVPAAATGVAHICPILPPYIAEYNADHNGHIRLSFTLYDGEIVEGSAFKPTADGRWQTSINLADVPTQCPQQLTLFLIYSLVTLETGIPPFTYTETTENFAAYTDFLVTHSTAVPAPIHLHYLPILTT